MIKATQLLLFAFYFLTVSSQILYLTGSSGKITAAITSVSTSITWQLKPSFSASSIQFIIQSLNVPQGSVYLYDTAYVSSGTYVWKCVSCDAQLPPTFYSTSGSVTLTAAGTTGVTFTPSSFSIQYVAIPNKLSSLSSNISVSLYAGYDKISPYNVNGQIPANSFQQWTIKQPTNTVVTFMFSYFNLGSVCTDNLYIYDGTVSTNNLIFSGCKSSDKPKYWLYSSSGTTIVRFVTGNQISSSKFLLSYYTNTPLYNCGSFLQPDELIGSTMILSDGSGSGNLMRRGVSCSWLLTPLVPGTVSLTFDAVSLKYGSTVMVYDNNKAKGIILWNGNGATLTIPPIITSSNGSLFVTYYSDTSDPIRYTGFTGKYTTNTNTSVGLGQGYSTLAMSSLVDIVPPGNNKLRQSSGGNYTWYIRPSQTLSSSIIFTLNVFSFPSSSSKLYLYDGKYNTAPGSLNNRNATLLAVYSSDSEALQRDSWITTYGKIATLVYSSSLPQVVVSKNYFEMSYYTDGPNYHCGFIRNPAVLTMFSWIITDGSASTETIYPAQRCEWLIQPDNATGVVLFFTRYNLIGGQLIVYEGRKDEGNVFTIINDTSNIPAFLYIPSTTVTIQYTTVSTSNQLFGYGFSLTYFRIVANDLLRSFAGNDVVQLRSSSALSLRLSYPDSDVKKARILLSPGVNYTWIFQPTNSVGKLFFAFSSLLLPDCSIGSLTLYQGNFIQPSAIVHTYCNESSDTRLQPYQWITTSSNQAILTFQTNPVFPNSNVSYYGDFELSYYSDGSNYHCGFLNNPAIMTASSMIITDGSSSTENMYADEYCTWLIQPTLISSNSIDSFAIVIELLQNDLLGGSLSIYAVDKDSLKSTYLIWECSDCQAVPAPLIIRNQYVFISFQTKEQSLQYGKGFRIVYWTATDLNGDSNLTMINSYFSHSPVYTVLEQPDNIVLSAKDSNSSIAYVLDTTTMTPGKTSTLFYYPSYSVDTITAMSSNNIWDGRSSKDSSAFASSSHSQISICGIVKNPPIRLNSMYQNILTSSTMNQTMAQQKSAYLISSIDTKTIYEIIPSFDTTSALSSSSAVSFVPTATCQYRFESDNEQAILLSIHLTAFSASDRKGRLRVFSGVYGYEYLQFDSWDNKQYRQQPMNLTIPCGKAIIMIEQNTSTSDAVIDYGFFVDYSLIVADDGRYCVDYKNSLLPQPKVEDPNIPYYISAGVVGGCILICFGVIYILKRKLRLGYYFFSKGFEPSKYMIATAKRATTSNKLPHPYYIQCINYLLPIGECCVCKVNTLRVIKLTCGHKICLDDAKGYLLSALGDISMFPIKCPMHYEGCTQFVDVSVAKRILNPLQYEKFVDFADRALYGEGMRCIFCRNYVCFPANNSFARVECPYCMQCFCIRCKQTWHFGKQKCPVDQMDDHLENWKMISGAQKCPCCAKLIEKDDPDTCNHMVHKITDSIPCVRERTDFCYLCGEEVTPDYPHEEVKRKGVNHFPEGVFQRCRKIVQQEKDAEREVMRKQRRFRGNTGSQRPTTTSSVLPVVDDVDGDDWGAWEQALTVASSAPPYTPNIRVINNVANTPVPAIATAIGTPVIITTPSQPRNRNTTTTFIPPPTLPTTITAVTAMATSTRTTRSLIFEEKEDDGLRTIANDSWPTTPLATQLSSPMTSPSQRRNNTASPSNTPTSPQPMIEPRFSSPSSSSRSNRRNQQATAPNITAINRDRLANGSSRMTRSTVVTGNERSRLM